MEGMNLLAEARATGLRIYHQGGTLVIRGPHKAHALAQRILQAKPLILRMLAYGLFCPNCDRPLDGKRRCWHCCDRRCACGRMTSSAFIATCLLCEHKGTLGANLAGS
jgi:hypothetical protein